MSKHRIRLVMLIASALIVISIGYNISAVLGYVSFIFYSVSDLLLPVFISILFSLLPAFIESESCKKLKQNLAANKLQIATGVLWLTGASEEERENIAGDLLEEFNRFDSRLIAYIWLYKQVLKSAAHLICKTVTSRLASYFGKRIR